MLQTVLNSTQARTYAVDAADGFVDYRYSGLCVERRGYVGLSNSGLGRSSGSTGSSGDNRLFYDSLCQYFFRFAESERCRQYGDESYYIYKTSDSE